MGYASDEMGRQKMEKRIIYKTTFIGGESAFLDTIRKYSQLHLIVCAVKKRKAKKYFGSAFDFARKHNIKVVSPENYMHCPQATDIIIVSGYPRIIPMRIINHPRIAIINIHQSLLPAYRGRHPLNWAIINGEKYTGITIHHINNKFDDGNIILQDKVRINKKDTVMDVYYKTVNKGNILLKKIFLSAGKKEFMGRKQDFRLSSFFPPRTPEDGKINWSHPIKRIRNLIRALSKPYPGAFFYYQGKKIVVDKLEAINGINFKREPEKPFFCNGSLMVKKQGRLFRISKRRI